MPVYTNSFTDRDIYRMLLEIAARADVTATMLEFDPTDAYYITCDDRRAAVWASEDGSAVEWELLAFHRRGSWRAVAAGSGNESDMRLAVVPHLRAGLGSTR